VIRTISNASQEYPLGELSKQKSTTTVVQTAITPHSMYLNERRRLSTEAVNHAVGQVRWAGLVGGVSSLIGCRADSVPAMSDRVNYSCIW